MNPPERGLLLGELEVGAASDQLDQNLIQAPAALLGEPGNVRVELGSHPKDDVAAVGLLGHLRNSTASGTIRSSQLGLAVSYHPALYSRKVIR